MKQYIAFINAQVSIIPFCDVAARGFYSGYKGRWVEGCKGVRVEGWESGRKIEHRTFNPPQADLWRKLKKYGMKKELNIEGRDEGDGRTWTDMDNGKIEYFDP